MTIVRCEHRRVRTVPREPMSLNFKRAPVHCTVRRGIRLWAPIGSDKPFRPGACPFLSRLSSRLLRQQDACVRKLRNLLLLQCFAGFLFILCTESANPWFRRALFSIPSIFDIDAQTLENSRESLLRQQSGAGLCSRTALLDKLLARWRNRVLKEDLGRQLPGGSLEDSEVFFGVARRSERSSTRPPAMAGCRETTHGRVRPRHCSRRAGHSGHHRRRPNTAVMWSRMGLSISSDRPG